MILFYVRHGQPTYNPDQLTPLGLRQAESVGRRLALFGVHRVYASSSNRAIQTARPLCDMLRLEPEILDWCNESHAWEEMHSALPDGRHCWCYVAPDMRQKLLSPELRPLGMEWYRHPMFADHPGFGRGVERVRDEAERLLASLGYEHDRAACLYRVARDNGERVALFAHEGFGNLFLSALLDIPYPLFCMHFTMQHSGITAVEFRDEGGVCAPMVLQLSSDGHLYRDALPLVYQDRVRL